MIPSQVVEISNPTLSQQFTVESDEIEKSGAKFDVLLLSRRFPAKVSQFIQYCMIVKY